MRSYCTLFNMKYAAKGLALWESLAKHSSVPFALYVLPMDTQTYEFLRAHRERLPFMVILDPLQVITGRLRDAFVNREIAYRCFMTTPWLINWVQVRYNVDEVTYLDADLGFYADPEFAHLEIDGRSVAIVPHRFPAHDVARLSPNGWYNVSWVTFRRDPHGSSILARWMEQCLLKCDRESCGDQKYLDEWPALLGANICVFENHGVGVAPWNASSYRFIDGPMIVPKGMAINPDLEYLETRPVVFYHFHELQREGPGQYRLTGYPISDECKRLIYKPYLDRLEVFEKVIEAHERKFPCASTI